MVPNIEMAWFRKFEELDSNSHLKNLIKPTKKLKKLYGCYLNFFQKSKPWLYIKHLIDLRNHHGYEP
jgi:hypothetical protein